MVLDGVLGKKVLEVGGFRGGWVAVVVRSEWVDGLKISMELYGSEGGLACILSLKLSLPKIEIRDNSDKIREERS